jgi:hypothetical protein
MYLQKYLNLVIQKSLFTENYEYNIDIIIPFLQFSLIDVRRIETQGFSGAEEARLLIAQLTGPNEDTQVVPGFNMSRDNLSSEVPDIENAEVGEPEFINRGDAKRLRTKGGKNKTRKQKKSIKLCNVKL